MIYHEGHEEHKDKLEVFAIASLLLRMISYRPSCSLW